MCTSNELESDPGPRNFGMIIVFIREGRVGSPILAREIWPMVRAIGQGGFTGG